MTAPDDLTARLTALVERVQRETKHTPTCAQLDRWEFLECDCDRDQRLAATLGRMMAAKFDAVIEACATEAVGSEHTSAACGAYLASTGERGGEYRCGRCLMVRAGWRAAEEAITASDRPPQTPGRPVG